MPPPDRAHRFRARPVGQVRAGEVGRAADEFGQHRRQALDRVLRRLARGDGLGLGVDRREQRLALRLPVGGQFARHAPPELAREFRMLFFVSGEALVPVGLDRGAARARVPARVDALRHLERRVIPADRRARGRDFLFAERRAVRVVRAGFVRRTLADDCLAANQAGTIRHRLGRDYRAVHRLYVVAVDCGNHVPAVGLEALGRVVGEPALHVPVDGYAVVVVERDQLAQLERAGERAGLVRNAFHQAAVAEEHISMMVDDAMRPAG